MSNSKTSLMNCTLVICLVLCYTHTLWGQYGRVIDHLTLESEILGDERAYAVYLPPDYDLSIRSYPVLYLLHGSGDDQTGWIQFGEVRRIADEAIVSGTSTPMIIIMPDANTGRKGYFNDPSDTWRYEDFFFEELMPHVESIYRIKSEKRYRAVAGLSMGGGGSFMYALHRPDVFSSACPLSAYIGPRDASEMEKRLGDDHTYTDEMIEKYVAHHNALSLIESMSRDDLSSVKWYIDCGDDDFLYEGNSLVHIALKKKDVPHEYRVRDGRHSWSYWRSALPEVLGFVSMTFHQP